MYVEGKDVKKYSGSRAFVSLEIGSRCFELLERIRQMGSSDDVDIESLFRIIRSGNCNGMVGRFWNMLSSSSICNEIIGMFQIKCWVFKVGIIHNFVFIGATWSAK